METHEFESLHLVRELHDDKLIERLKHVLSRQRGLTAEMICHLCEVEMRGIHARLGYASMHEYCVEALHMSDSEAYVRMRAARLSRDFPEVLGMLAKGEIHLTALKLLGPFMTKDNCEQLLSAARFATKREIARLVGTHDPKPDVKNVVRKLPGTARVPEASQQQPLREPASSSSADANQPPSLELRASQSAPDADVHGGWRVDNAAVGLRASVLESAPRTEAPLPKQSADTTEQALIIGKTVPKSAAGSRTPNPPVTQLREDRYRVQFTADQEIHDNLTQAQELMRHQIPDGDIARVINRALLLLIEHQMKQHFATCRKPRASKAAATEEPHPQSRHIPNEVRRQVWARDGGQCAYVSPDRRRCQQRARLEFHHKHPYARRGPATLANICLRCSAHNFMHAQDDYGHSFMQQRVERSRRKQREVAEPAQRGEQREGLIAANCVTGDRPEQTGLELDARELLANQP